MFTSDDDFGYSNQLQSLLAENTASDYAFKQSIIDHESEKSTYENSKNSIQKSISKKQVEKNDWKKIKSAWSSQSNLSGASEDATSQYLNFQEQLKASSKEEKEQVMVNISSSINDKISQIDQELEQLEMEQSKLTPPASYDNEKSSQEYKKKQLVEQTIATAKQKSIEFKEAQEKYNLELSTLFDYDGNFKDDVILVKVPTENPLFILIIMSKIRRLSLREKLLPKFIQKLNQGKLNLLPKSKHPT